MHCSEGLRVEILTGSRCIVTPFIAVGDLVFQSMTRGYFVQRIQPSFPPHHLDGELESPRYLASRLAMGSEKRGVAGRSKGH